MKINKKMLINKTIAIAAKVDELAWECEGLTRFFSNNQVASNIDSAIKKIYRAVTNLELYLENELLGELDENTSRSNHVSSINSSGISDDELSSNPMLRE